MEKQLFIPASLEKHDVRSTVNLDLSYKTMGRIETGKTVNWPEGWGTVDHKEFINNLYLKECFPVCGQKGFWLTSKRCLLWCPQHRHQNEKLEAARWAEMQKDTP